MAWSLSNRLCCKQSGHRERRYSYESETASWSAHCQEIGGRRKDKRWDYHPGYRQGETGWREVIAVGDGRIKEDGTKIPMEAKKGDRILFAKYAGTEVKIDGEEHLIMKEDDVLAIIEQ